MSSKTLQTTTNNTKVTMNAGLEIGDTNEAVTLEDGTTVGGPQNVTIFGDLIVKGQTTTIQSSTLSIDDPNIILGEAAEVTGLTATLSGATSEQTVTLTDGKTTTGLIPGMTLTETGTNDGAFGNSGVVTISSITNSTTFEVSHGHGTNGAIVFKAGVQNDTTADGGGITLKGASDYKIVWMNDTNAWEVNQHFYPDADSTYDLGSNTIRWQNIYADNIYSGDLHLTNERGSWTVIEEENYLSLRNNKNGKMFKIVMQEISEE